MLVKKKLFVILSFSFILFIIIPLYSLGKDILSERDTDYDKAFSRTSGWTGADGTYSVPLSDGRTVWLFSDTFIGDVTPSGKRAEGTKIVNNSIALQKGKDPSSVEFIYGGTKENPESLFKPPDGTGWFWFHDGMDGTDGKIIVFLDQMERTDEKEFGFRQTGSWTAEAIINGNNISIKNYRKLPYFQASHDEKPTITFGVSILLEKNWTYIYGTEDYESTKNLLVARIPSGTLPADTQWEFYTGSGWSRDMKACKPIYKEVENELSVHKNEEGEYILITKKGGLDPDIELIFGDMPEGPWSTPLIVWQTPEANNKVFTYNAKAHPELSDKNKGLLISYNVNAWDFNDSLLDGNIYRPRFIRVHLMKHNYL